MPAAMGSGRDSDFLHCAINEKANHLAYGIRLKVWGQHACFTRPEMKVERVSYDVMTPSAARGILEAIHWKPAIRWVIDAIHVLKPIRFQSIKRNEVGQKISVYKARNAMKAGHVEGLHLLVGKDRQQRAATVLADVAYIIDAHFELTGKGGAEDNEGKHLDIFKRRAMRGQCFHQPCLGTREFAAHFELVNDHAPPPAAITESRDLGLMLWDIDHGAVGRPALFFHARLEEGVMKVPGPGSDEIFK